MPRGASWLNSLSRTAASICFDRNVWVFSEKAASKALSAIRLTRRVRPSEVRAMRFVDHHGQPTEAYPANPNGSPDGLTAVTTADGRFTALMPHPERVFRNAQMSWTAGHPAVPSPWMRMFHNARRWVR